jgi:hypothetical protein
LTALLVPGSLLADEWPVFIIEANRPPFMERSALVVAPGAGSTGYRRCETGVDFWECAERGSTVTGFLTRLD